MKLSAILAPLVAAGVDPETLLKTVIAFENQQEGALEKRRESDRERQARKRASDAPSRDVTLCHSDRQPSRSHVRAEDKSSNKQISGKEEKEEAAPAALSDLQGFMAELSELDAERVEALVKHRRAKKAQLTAHAARLFKADAAKARISLPEAVDTCISRNWITVKADWLQNNHRQPTAPPKPKTVGEMFREDARRMGILTDEQPTSTEDRHLDPRDRTAESGGSGITRRFALPADVLGRVGQG